MVWPLVKIKECCTVVGGATPRRDVPEYWGNDFPWVTPKDISNLEQPILEDAPEYISQAGYDSAATYMLPREAILLTSRAPIGNVAIAGREMCTNQGFKSLVPGEGVDSKYLYYCMKRMAPKLESIGNGATFKEVSKTIVEGFEIPLPPLKEQKRIAAILDKADAIRHKRQQAIQLTDEFLRSVFLDMFGDPITNPNNWNEVALDQIATIRSGVTKGRKFNGKPTVILPYMRVANVQDGWINLSDVQSIEILENEVERFLLKAGDLLLTEGGDPDKLGRGAVWYDKITPCIHQNHIFAVRVNQDIILPEFLSTQIGSQRGKRYFLKVGKQTTGIATINKTVLSAYPALVPPIQLQEKYVGLVERMSRHKRKHQKLHSHGAELFHSVSQRVFRGDL